jgi:hypothetical protein
MSVRRRNRAHIAVKLEPPGCDPALFAVPAHKESDAADAGNAHVKKEPLEEQDTTPHVATAETLAVGNSPSDLQDFRRDKRARRPLVKQEPHDETGGSAAAAQAGAERGLQTRGSRRPLKTEQDSGEESKLPTKTLNKSAGAARAARFRFKPGEEPPQWREVLANITTMRAARNAPVDTMGCEVCVRRTCVCACVCVFVVCVCVRVGVRVGVRVCVCLLHISHTGARRPQRAATCAAFPDPCGPHAKLAGGRERTGKAVEAISQHVRTRTAHAHTHTYTHARTHTRTHTHTHAHTPCLSCPCTRRPRTR